MKLKPYTTNTGGRVSSETARLIGIDHGRTQCAVIVIAATKKAAAAMVDAERAGDPRDLRLNEGFHLAVSLRDFANGIPGVYATAMTLHAGNPIALIENRESRIVGVVGRGSTSWDIFIEMASTEK